MSEYLERQKSVLRRVVFDYRKGHLHLNTLVQKIEGITAAIDLKSWEEAVSPIISELEQVNAIALDEKRRLNALDEAAVTNALRELDSIIEQFQDESSA